MATTPASVSALLKPRKSTERNAFPLDHRQVYSIKAGQITPVKCMKFVPNDHFSIEVGEFCITFPMQTAPFLRGRKETVFYSVYNSAIWSLFNQYIGQRSDPKTSALNTNLKEPRIALWDLYRPCLSQLLFYLNYKIGIPALIRNTYANASEERILGLITAERENFLEVPYSSSDVWGSSDYPIVFNPSSDVVYSDKVDFTLNYNDIEVNPNVITPLYRDYCQDIVGQFRVFNYLRKLDMLGYGNLVPWFKEMLDTCENWLADMEDFGDTAYASLVSDINKLFAHLVQRVVQICFSYTNPDSQSGFPTSTSTVTPVYKNLYAICAYNLIFYHFFRNSFYDLRYNSRDYNLDFVSAWSNDSGNDFNVVSITDFSCRFLDIEYHQWKKDQFTGVLPDTQFGAVSSLTISSNIVTYNPLVVNSSGIYLGNRDLGSLSDGSLGASVSSPGSYLSKAFLSGGTTQGSFDMIALKRAEILQDYRQTLMRAGNKTSDIFNALYGGSPSSEHEDDIIPRFIETFGEDVFVDPVTATANTEAGSNGTLGDLSARGKFSGSSKKFTFNAGHNFGVVMCLTYFVPSSEYNSYFIDPANNCLNPEDHYITQFENMGLEPVYSEELNSLQARNSLSVLGYAPRYHYLKSQVDVVHGEFVSLPESQKLIPTQGYSPTITRSRYSVVPFNGMFNIWVSPRTDLQNRNSTQLRDFYINPALLDNIFVQSVDATQGSDNLICNTYLNWQATRGMSKVGLMNFV